MGKKNMKLTKSFIPKSKLSTRDKIYDVHDNGGRPFRVIANNKGIHIFIEREEDKKNQIGSYPMQYNKLIKKITNFLGYWSGFDSSPYKTKMHGNSILIQLTKKKYMSIGYNIYTFETESEIIDYVSPVGNSDVPYPISYDKDNVYFMIEQVYIKRSELTIEPNVANAEHIYGEFYGHIGSKKHVGHKMKHLKIVYLRLS